MLSHPSGQMCHTCGKGVGGEWLLNIREFSHCEYKDVDAAV